MSKRILKYMINAGCVMSLTACINLTEPDAPTELVQDYNQRDWISSDQFGAMTSSLQTNLFAQIHMPELRKLMDEAMSNNQAFLADEADYLALALASNQAAAGLLPKLALESTSTRSKARALFDDGNTYEKEQGLQLLASWELDFWGRIRAERRQGKAEMKRAQYELAASRDALLGLVTRQWLSLWLTNQQIKIEQERVDIFSMLQTSASEQYANGLTNYEDVSLAQISLKTAQASVMQLQYMRSEIARQIEVLIGRYPRAELTYSGGFPKIDKPILFVPTEVIANRPDIQAAYANLHEMHFQLEAQNRALLPSFTLSASVGKSRPSWGDIFDSSLLWSVVGGISQSLFVADLIDAGPLTLTKASEQLKRAATLRYRQTVLDAFLEIENALAMEGSLVARQDLLIESVVHAKSTYIDYTERYQNGLVSFVDLLTIQAQYLDAQLTLLDVQAGLLYNRVRLGLALGISTQHNLSEDQLEQEL